jgi:hypothetical protein
MGIKPGQKLELSLVGINKARKLLVAKNPIRNIKR